MTQLSWLLLFAFSPPFFFRFSGLISFSLAGHLAGLVGKVFRKAFRILGLGERKGGWVMEQDFHGDFQVNVTWFFACFSGILDWIVLILVWFERSLHSAQVSEESCPWSLKLMTSQWVERTWIRTGGYGRFRGKWVNFCSSWFAYLTTFLVFPIKSVTRSNLMRMKRTILMVYFILPPKNFGNSLQGSNP